MPNKYYDKSIKNNNNKMSAADNYFYNFSLSAADNREIF